MVTKKSAVRGAGRQDPGTPAPPSPRRACRAPVRAGETSRGAERDPARAETPGTRGDPAGGREPCPGPALPFTLAPTAEAAIRPGPCPSNHPLWTQTPAAPQMPAGLGPAPAPVPCLHPPPGAGPAEPAQPCLAGLLAPRLPLPFPGLRRASPAAPRPRSPTPALCLREFGEGAGPAPRRSRGRGPRRLPRWQAEVFPGREALVLLCGNPMRTGFLNKLSPFFSQDSASSNGGLGR